MDILWGAWATEVIRDAERQIKDIIGIYDEIWKERKADFPFRTDLLAVWACQAEVAEFGRTHQITLNIIDVAGNSLCSVNDQLTVGRGDTPYRWYETSEFPSVEIEEPGYYELSILVDKQVRHCIPLWVIAPKMMILDPERDSTTEMWPEDYEAGSD